MQEKEHRTLTEEEKKRLRECHYIRCRKGVMARLFRHRVGPVNLPKVSRLDDRVPGLIALTLLKPVSEGCSKSGLTAGKS